MNKQISIPKPCNENWELMTPTAKGRFCDRCTKVVMDFSAMSNEEILDYLNKQKGEVCGRVRKDQLNNAPTLTDKLKKFLYAFALVFLPFLSFDALGQNVTGVPFKKIEVNDSSLNQLSEIIQDSNKNNIENKLPKTSSKTVIIKTKGGIYGEIKNLQGDLIKNATITIKQNGKIIATTFSDTTGNYNITPLAKGSYEIECAAPNYKTSILLNAHLKQSKKWYISIELGKLNNTDPREFLVSNAPAYTDPDSYIAGSVCSHTIYREKILDSPDWFNRVKKIMNLNTDR